MKNNFKRILSIFLVAVMCLSIFPTSIFADEAMPVCQVCNNNGNVRPTGKVNNTPTCTEAAGVWYVCGNEHGEDKIPLEFFVEYDGSKAYHSDATVYVYTEKQDATCVETGVEENWYCPHCKTYYKSAAMKKDNAFANEADTIIPVKDFDVEESHVLGSFFWKGGIEPVCGVNGGVKVWTCTVEGCDYSKEEKVDVKPHVWAYDNYDGNLGCTTEVTVTVKCECGATETRVGLGWAHEYIKTDAVAKTCTTAGNEVYYTCKHCGKFFMDVDGGKEEVAENAWVVPASHEYGTLIAAVGATCTTAGNRAYYDCSECEKFFDEDKKEIAKDSWIIPADGHDVAYEEANAPDCVNDGRTAYYDCKNCDLYFADLEDGDDAYADAKVYCNGAEVTVKVVAKDSWFTGAEKLGHNFEDKDAVIGGCNTVPTIAHKYCAECDKNYATDAGEFEAFDNALTSILANIIVPNPNGSNSTIEVTPDDALYALVQGEQHSWTYTGVVNPTCFLPGWTTWTCSECSEYTGAANAYSVDLAPTNHGSITAANIVSKVDPTCVQTGMDAYAQCPDCNYYFAVDAEGNVITDRFYNDTNAFVLPTVNTNHNEGVVIAGSTASCLVDGKPETHICTWCWTHYYYVDGEVVNIGAFSNSNFAGLVGYEEKHTVENGKIVFVPAEEATCAADGNIAYYYCADCNKYYAADADGNIVNAYNADNDWIGYVELTDVVTTRAHDYGTIIAATYNCGVAGYDAYYVCQYDDCKKIFDADKNETTMADLWREATGDHDHSIVVSAGGQTVVDGTVACLAKILKCSVCSDVVSVSTHNFVDKDYHYFGDFGSITVATCAAEGCYAMECSYCEEYETDENGEVIKYTEAKKPHGQEGVKTVLAVAPDCIALTDGNVRYNVCNKCGGKFEDDALTIEIPAGEEIVPVTHTPVAYSTTATVCGGEYAVAQFKCSVCERYALTADTAAREWTAEPTMTSVATSHTGDLVSNNDYVDSDCLTAGHKKTFTCNGECGKTYILVDGAYVEADETNVVIAVKAHNGTFVAYEAPNCTTAGNVAYYTACTNGCGKIYGATAEGALDTTVVYDDVVIVATGHTQTDANTVAAVASVCNGVYSISNGNIEYYVCDGCGKMFKSGETAADAVALDQFSMRAEPHEQIDHLVDGSVVFSKCTEFGYYAMQCECGYTYYKFTAPLQHKITDKNETKINSDCQNTGLEVYYYCDNCKIYYKDVACTEAWGTSIEDVTIATVAHTNAAGEVIVASCDNGEFVWDAEAKKWIEIIPDRECQWCEYDGTLDHEWTDGETEQTCITPESNYKVCRVCLTIDENTRVVIGESNPTAHGKHETHITPETICTDSNRFYETCVLCNNVVGDAYAGEHDIYEFERVDATCVAPGYVIEKCRNCSWEKRTDLDKGEHNPGGWETNKAYIGSGVNLYTVADAQARYCDVENCPEADVALDTREMPDVNFAVSLDNGVVAGATLVNSGKLAVTIKLSAFEKKVNILNFSFNYSDNLTFAKIEYGAIADMFQDNTYHAEDGVFKISSMEYDDFFNLGEVEINGADLVYAVVYFDINAAEAAGTVTVNGLSVNELKGIDGEPDAYTTGNGVSVDYTILGDIDGDGVVGNETQTVMQILASGDYNASVDFDKDGEITVADFMAYRAFTVNGDYSALVSSKS